MTVRPAHVLYVDDDGALRDPVSEALRRELGNATVTAVGSADEAEAALDAADPPIDCVVADYDLPDRDGLDLLRGVRERDPELPVVLFTGEGSEAIASESISAGVTDYLRKGGPDSHQRLADRVGTAVESRRTEGTRYAEGYERLVENSADAMAVLEDGRYRLVNGEAAELAGRPREEMVGATDGELFPAPMAETLREHAERAVETGRPTRHRLEATIDREERVFEVVHAPHEDGPGARRGVVRICREVTDQAVRERLLREERDRLESLAGSVAHDARNAIQLIDGRTQLAKETVAEDPDSARDHLGAVEKGVTRLRELVASLETLRGVSDPVTDPEAVSVGTAAREAWGTVDAPDATLEVVADPVVEGDPARFRTLLENLLRNAVDHGGPDVTVVVDRLADGPGFAVSDDGPGVPPDERDRVFRFGHSSDGGTGFGLGIVAGIAEAHGWDVSVAESDSGGARFEFRPETIDSFVS